MLLVCLLANLTKFSKNIQFVNLMLIYYTIGTYWLKISTFLTKNGCAFLSFMIYYI